MNEWLGDIKVDDYIFQIFKEPNTLCDEFNMQAYYDGKAVAVLGWDEENIDGMVQLYDSNFCSMETFLDEEIEVIKGYINEAK